MVHRSNRTLRDQGGFTLLELAIVLVIIGIILGAVLKGQELINNAKTKRFINDMKGLAAIQFAFYDRYGRFAGDCDNNGSIDANYLVIDMNSYDNNPNISNPANIQWCYNPASPQVNFDHDVAWAELVKAQLFPPAKHTRDIVRHAFSGPFAFVSVNVPQGNQQQNNQNLTPPPFNAVLATQVPCYAAKALDVAIDNSIDATSGAVRKVANQQNQGGGNNQNPLETTAADWGCQNENEFVGVVYFFDRRPN